uniref:SEA domain-containing protein n=1 Tax=Magallana gigas TaxID=29159 RepID=K1QCS2_MAGGI
MDSTITIPTTKGCCENTTKGRGKHIRIILNAFYKDRISGFIKVIILVIRRGSTIVEHEVIADKSEEANQDLVKSVLSLTKGGSNITYENTPLTVSSVAVNDASGNPKGIGIVDSSDDFKLIVGLGVGIPLFVLAVLIGIIIAFFVRRRRHPREMSLSSSDDNFENTYGRDGMYFTSGMPTKIDSWGRYGSPYSPHNWSGHDGKRGRDGFDDYREPYIYDNGVQSNFSWDFMYQALQPNEKFQIKRPEVSPKPRNTERLDTPHEKIVFSF